MRLDMNKYYLISKETGEVKSVCDDIIGYDKEIFNLKKITTTTEQDNLIQQNYKLKYTDKLKLEKPLHILEAEKKADFKDKIDKATTLKELKDLLINNL